MEPVLLEGPFRAEIADLAIDVQREASSLTTGLHPETIAEMADFVRLMNCYYSNLIEGHNTRPRDIERALSGAQIEPERRALAIEAKAHVEVQREIDALHRAGRLPAPTSTDFVRWVHRRFYEAMPDEFRRVSRSDGTTVEIVPGEFRSTSDHDVVVGRHQPPSSDRVGDFMRAFAERSAMGSRGAAGRIVSIATAHHRLNYVHPFVDGNGRVSRLVSHAMGLDAGIGGGGLWSISRGLARGLRERGEYRRMMDHADRPRQGSRDGRGNLSKAALEDFVVWFLSVAVDQLRFSRVMFDVTRLDDRYRALALDVCDDRRAPDLVSAVLRYGALPRGDAEIVLRTSERTARNTMSELVSRGFVRSDGPKTPVRISFPLDYRERLFPNLFTEAEVVVPEPPPHPVERPGDRRGITP